MMLKQFTKLIRILLLAASIGGSFAIYAQPALAAKKNLPDDPGFTQNSANIDKQWGLVKSHFLEAWDITTGDPSVIVAVIDTGIDATHEDFKNTKFANGYNTITDQAISKHSNSDNNGHGTLVAGIIAASTDNKIGIAGAARGVTLMPIKALDSDGSGRSSDITEGIIWATDHGADIINMSLGGAGFSHDTKLANAISYAFNKDVVIISAAGNDVAITGGNLDKDPVFPICNDNGKNMVIGVTATDVNDLKPSFANFGKACVDVSAPGKRILSTINHDPANGSSRPDSYAYASGTSLAVPLVAAEAALLRSEFPKANNRQIRDRIISSADNIDVLNLSQCRGELCQGLLGGGRINALRSLQEKIPDISDGDLVRIKGTNTYYYINGGKKQLISMFVLHQKFKQAEIKQVSFDELKEFSEGSYAEPLDGTLVMSPSNPTIYYIQKGLRLPITGQIFAMRGFQYSNVILMDDAEINSWVEGKFLTPPDGTLIRTANNPTVYWAVGGIMHPINGKFYNDRGLNKFPVINFSDSDLSSLPIGDSYIL